jgi:hypothetical protein
VVAECSEEKEQALDDYGRNLGIAFQLVDDAIDYDSGTAEMGKNRGDDFREGKMTLPVILAYARGTGEERRFWQEAIAGFRTEDEDLAHATRLILRHDCVAATRELDGQDEKKGRLDFALWKKAKPEHIMRWNSPWGAGFPGWHIECSAMSQKYLGETFDIHGGGMDLIPTHHTNEIAQSVGCCGNAPVNYWIHTNMLTLNGQKMSRSLGNVFLPVELFQE